MNLAEDSARYRRLRQLLCATLVLIVAAPGAIWLVSTASATIQSSRTASEDAAKRPISAPGRIEPLDGVLAIAAPATELGPAIVTTLHVREGQWVESGTVLATLNGNQPLQAAFAASQQRIAIARTRLDALLAGGKAEDLRAARADVASAEATVAQADADVRRAHQLRQQQLLSTASVEAQESKLEIAQRALEASRARLDGLSRTRPADLRVAEAEVSAAEADSKAVQAQLENTLIRAPSAGRVLAVYAHPGQAVGPEGVLAFGRTDQMYVDAEIMEDDLDRVRVGREVTIRSNVLEGGKASGTVEKIGYLIGSRETFVTDPTAFTDSRIVHVKIRVADAARFERFINARVTVEIR
jgi:HlyD family secretion protein